MTSGRPKPQGPAAAARRSKGGKPNDGTRPPDHQDGYIPEWCQIARKMCELGALDRDVAQALGVSEQMMRAWRNKYPEFAQAFIDGGAMSDLRVTRALYNRAIGYSYDSEKLFYDKDTGTVVRAAIVEHVPPDVGAQQFWLKNRQGQNWRDKQTQEHTGPDGGPLVVEIKGRDGDL